MRRLEGELTWQGWTRRGRSRAALAGSLTFHFSRAAKITSSAGLTKFARQFAQLVRPRRYTRYIGQTPFRKEASRRNWFAVFLYRKDSIRGERSSSVAHRPAHRSELFGPVSIIRSCLNSGTPSGSKNVSYVTGVFLSDSGTASLWGREGTYALSTSPVYVEISLYPYFFFP
jgi:hypothetical protein